MTLLIAFVLLAILVSFLCSVFEAVLLSMSTPFIALQEKQGKRSGQLLRKLKDNINAPLAAILTLNTIAHTIGAAGAGAQAATVFGSASLGIFSAVLTFLILVFSEIIPKTIGAQYWQRLATVTAYSLHYMIILLYPFIKMSDLITGMLSSHKPQQGLSRSEFAVMAEVSEQEGHIASEEATILLNLLKFKETKVRDVMTPRVVVFSADQSLTIAEFLQQQDKKHFSRIPVFEDDKEHITGFIIRTDVLEAMTKGEGERPLVDFKRDIKAVIETTTLAHAFDLCIQERSHILLVVDEYGQTEGIVTQEDMVETLFGLEIMDESDRSADLQVVAKRWWQRRSLKLDRKQQPTSSSSSKSRFSR
ncbi:hemolysin family protein [Neiella marina]|uniref:Hemolysin family protein n=1 Tax=Neiella holothuriorum TaxID=2870530 RepID=A0ABS7EBL4_9GAMM|nr:hemolysin family protein [Neiella holothuriorum]MBW8189620.1 hemolysin family protein [Neiella holothuriorum]